MHEFDVAGMLAAIDAYFSTEKRESLLFIAVGLTAVAVGIWLLATAHAYRGMAYPFIAIAAIQLIVGATVYFRTDAQVAALRDLVEADAQRYVREERARMETVQRSFTIYKWIEVALLACGIIGVLALRGHPLLHGVAVGLMVQSALMLTADLVAEHRADKYVIQMLLRSSA